MKDQNIPVLRIHGDNILECERALQLIAQSFALEILYLASPIYFPRYALVGDTTARFYIELLAGHARWNVNLQNVLREQGAPLREAADAVVTRVEEDGTESILLALEFSSALPAGNNAWQRHGRALTCATVGVAYLYLAEVGGVELGAARQVKASRFPNPIVPFSYLAADSLFNSICVPVYAPSYTIAESLRTQFASALDESQGASLVRALLTNSAVDAIHQESKARALRMTEILAQRRKRQDTWVGNEWAEFLVLETANARMMWLGNRSREWKRKIGAKVSVSRTFAPLSSIFSRIGCLSIGGGDIPICWIPANRRNELAQSLSILYAEPASSRFRAWLASRAEPLFVVWITGFKPDGEDSRPDRGLLPLTRMLFGYEADVLTIVSGPAKVAMWESLSQSPERLAEQNGLWETIINLSNALLADSATLAKPILQVLNPVAPPARKIISFRAASAIQKFSEHDVDTALHYLFSNAKLSSVYEAMCNPPGGDWSGLSLLDWQTNTEYRWTSLPRVSGAKGKRPDHVIQINADGKTVLLVIESKTKEKNLEAQIGPRLTFYVRELIQSMPTTIRTVGNVWQFTQETHAPFASVEMISGGAFCSDDKTRFEEVANRCEVDVVFAFEFRSGEQPSLLRVFVRPRAEFLLPILRELVGNLRGNLEIEVR